MPTIWFTWTDLTLVQGDSSWLALRLLVRVTLVAALVAGAWLVPRSGSRERYERLALTITVTAALCLVALNALRPPSAGLPLRSPLMWLFALYAGFPNRPWRQFVAPFVLTGGILLLPAFWDADAHRESLSGNLLVLLTVNAIGVLLVYRRHELLVREATWERDAESRLIAEQSLRELRTLRGIIPICAHCKKVRTEVGDWQQVEEYVRRHSTAEFSHGVCPSCMEEHYGKFLEVGDRPDTGNQAPAPSSSTSLSSSTITIEGYRRTLASILDAPNAEALDAIVKTLESVPASKERDTLLRAAMRMSERLEGKGG
ncbi:MAG: hypothetical protein ACT4P7_01510 [Gemmatimonadaceae bacterium]